MKYNSALLSVDVMCYLVFVEFQGPRDNSVVAPHTEYPSNFESSRSMFPTSHVETGIGAHTPTALTCHNPDTRTQKCISHNCAKQGTLQYGGYCNQCYLTSPAPQALTGNEIPREVTSSLSSSGLPVQNESKETHGFGIPLESERHGRPLTNNEHPKCIVKFCPNIGSSHTDDLCYGCYTTLQKKQLEKRPTDESKNIYAHRISLFFMYAIASVRPVTV